MKKMIIDAGNNADKIELIKSKQIVGVELQHSIFSLLCSNMYVHGDGRSNLIKGSCFDETIIDSVKSFKPNVGMLNPPYKANKNDIEEYEFIINNLSLLEKGSLCVAIIPKNRTIANKGSRLKLKEKLMNENTLEAVFSMPNELFANSNVGVHTCIMIFRAKEKHPPKYKTYFGYWKDDGFAKIKNTGRTDCNNKWSKIKTFWLEKYRNKEEIVGHSIKRKVTAKDEWCVEAYLKTDYLKLTKEDFVNSIHNFVSFQFIEKNINEIKNEKRKSVDLELFLRKWKFFNYTDLFDEISRGNRLIETDRLSGDALYFSASEFNNGCTDRISNPLFIKKDSIIYTTFGDAYYVKGKFTASDEVSIFNSNKLNIYNGLFISTIMSKNKYKYAFGRKAFRNKFIKDFIGLPTTKGGNPDWQFMEDYIKSLPYSKNL